MRKLSEISRHESSLPNKFVGGIKVISAVTTPDLHSGGHKSYFGSDDS